MRKMILLAFLAAAVAQDKKSAEYVNDDLKIKFTGVYGWDKKTASGSGAWTELASYTHPQFGAVVQLFARDNPYETSSQLRAAINNEFKDKQYKEFSLKDVTMKKGLKLPGFQAEAFATRVNEEGKKREYAVIACTYFGNNRLFRVHCSAPRSRARRVRDLFDVALGGLTVTGEDERVSRGQAFYSQRGLYSCMIPEGYSAVLPAAKSKSDMRFSSRREGVTITVYSYYYEGILADHVEELLDFYGDDVKMENEDADVLKGRGFIATRVKGESTSLITGTVRDRRVYRIHTSAATKKLEDAKRVHAAFLKTFGITKRR